LSQDVTEPLTEDDSNGEVASGRQTWLVVSNHQNRSWDKLFSQGKEIFRGGKLKGNFKAAQIGDLVFGYTGAPKLKLEALARVSRAMFMTKKIRTALSLSLWCALNAGVV